MCKGPTNCIVLQFWLISGLSGNGRTSGEKGPTELGLEILNSKSEFAGWMCKSACKRS